MAVEGVSWLAMSERTKALLDKLWAGVEDLDKQKADQALSDLHERLKPSLWDYEVALVRQARGPAEVIKVQHEGEVKVVERLYGDGMRNSLMDFYQDEAGTRSVYVDLGISRTCVKYFEGPVGRAVEVGQVRLEGKEGKTRGQEREAREVREAQARQWALGWCGFGLEGLAVEAEEVAGID